MSNKSTIRAYTAWWPDAETKTYEDAEQTSTTELWTAEYMKDEGFSNEDIEVVENLQPGESHSIHVEPPYNECTPFDVVVEYEGETYEDTSYTFEREEHHLNWYEVSGRGDY